MVRDLIARTTFVVGNIKTRMCEIIEEINNNYSVSELTSYTTVFSSLIIIIIICEKTRVKYNFNISVSSRNNFECQNFRKKQMPKYTRNTDAYFEFIIVSFYSYAHVLRGKYVQMVFFCLSRFFRIFVVVIANDGDNNSDRGYYTTCIAGAINRAKNTPYWPHHHSY